MRYDFSGHLSLRLCHGPLEKERERESATECYDRTDVSPRRGNRLFVAK